MSAIAKAVAKQDELITELLAAAEKALFALCSIEPTTENLAARKHLREAIGKATGTQR